MNKEILEMNKQILERDAEIKAKEILGKYFDFVCPAKPNAIICVDIILDIVPYESFTNTPIHLTAEFWRLVKQKIQNYEQA